MPRNWKNSTVLSAVLATLQLVSQSLFARDLAKDSAETDYSSELPRIEPLSPEQALDQFEVLDGFQVQLVACEPLVTDPIAFSFDARGRLWVVEMRDYSEQDTERLGRIALLSDTDQDGRMDHRTTFVENLSWPTALWPWLDGVLVAEPPHITWYRDTNGDGVADQSEVWYSGFGRSNVQGMVNSLRWGVDAWIHGATSSTGASLQSAVNDERIELGRRDFAIDPITKALRPESGGGQHGMGFNRWGDKFVTANSDHLQQVVDMEDWLANHAVGGIPFPSLRRSIAEDGPQAEVFRASPVEPWRIVRTRLRMSGVVPGIVEGGGRAAGYFTGATGTWVMDRERGYGLPETDTAIVCDVGSNLVHRKTLLDQGLFFNSRRIDPQTELLRSRDIWFRPVQIGDGPDGGLYIADMYREVIEHPLSIPPVIKKHLDLTSGRDRGRIWKLTSRQTPSAAFDDLSRLEDADLVARLASDFSWHRLMASQLLVERYVLKRLDRDLVGSLLRKTASTSDRPEARVLSLWLLHRLDVRMSPSHALELLAQTHPRVLAHAVEIVGFKTLSESQEISSEERNAVQMQLTGLAQTTEDSRVQLSLAKISPHLDEDQRWKMLGCLIPRVQEPMVRATIATCAGNRSWQLFRSEMSHEWGNSVYSEWLGLLLPGWIAAAKADRELADFVKEHLQTGHPRQQAWLNALPRASSHAAVSTLLQQIAIQSSVDQLVTSSLAEQVDPRTVSWLGLTSPEIQTEWMLQLIQSAMPESLQSAAISALNWANHTGLVEHLIANFRGMTPSLQHTALRAITARPERLPLLAEALESGQIARSQIAPEFRQTLLSGPSTELIQRFTKVLSSVSGDREAVLQRYQEALASAELDRASPAAGKAVFERSCAQCHRLGQVGNDVGPPLQQLGEKSPLQLMEAILDPSREVDPKYAAYNVLTVEGLVINGIIIQESGNQIVIAESGGRQTTLDRDSIDQINSSGLSLMPEGLEEQITPDQMLELIRFLQIGQNQPR